MALAPRTVSAYRTDWDDFAGWCATHDEVALPAPVRALVAFVDERSTTHRVSTLRRRLAAIRAAHLAAELTAATDAPEVTAAMTRARWRQRHVVDVTNPISVDELRTMSRARPDTRAGTRDRAAILVGYGAALRPGELVALDVTDLDVGLGGLRVATRRGTVHVPYGSAPELCAVAAWSAWRDLADLGAGPAFRPVDRHDRVGPARLGEKAVGRIVRRAAQAAGLDPRRFCGLSLRRGMVDAAAANGASRRVIMRQTGHRSDRWVREQLGADG